MPTILSLDGGGTRGFFALSLLQQLSNIAFDAVIGTSVGAIVGAIISFELDIHKFTPHVIQRLASVVFGDKQRLGGLLKPMYRGELKRRALADIFGQKTLFKDAHIPLQVLVATLDGQSVLLSSVDDNSNLLLIDVLDAATAAPVYFPPVTLACNNCDYTHRYIDYGIIQTNPIAHAILDTSKLFKSQSKILSIGCSVPVIQQDIDAIEPHHIGLVEWYFNGDIVDVASGNNDNTQHRLAKLILGQNRYLRVSCSEPSAMDDTNDDLFDHLNTLATRIVKKYGDRIKQFVSS